jgi:hypothetical protein
VFITTPVGAGGANQLESFDFTRRANMGPAAQIKERALLVQANLLIVGKFVNQFQFV